MQLTDGDLSLGASSDYQMVTDAPKVKQDLRCALLEPLANDRFHPGWGSSLEDNVGLPLNDTTRINVLTEVNRVVGNYASIQRDRIETDLLSSTETRFGTDEIVSAVTNIGITQNQDSLKVEISIGTVAGSDVQIVEEI